MAPKRGRPVSMDITDPVVLRRRELTAARVRRHRQKSTRTAGNAPLNPRQLLQSDAVIESALIDVDAELTDAFLGLCVADLPLPRDSDDAHLQQNAIPVNEHDMLYHPHIPHGKSPPRVPHHSLPVDDSLAMLFRDTQENEYYNTQDVDDCGILEDEYHNAQDDDHDTQENNMYDNIQEDDNHNTPQDGLDIPDLDEIFPQTRSNLEPSPTPSQEHGDYDTKEDNLGIPGLDEIFA